jgi:hypothetical protein
MKMFLVTMIARILFATGPEEPPYIPPCAKVDWEHPCLQNS